MSSFGRGRLAGGGSITTPRRSSSSHTPLTSGSRHSRSSTSRFRSNRRPRAVKGTPHAWNSRSYQPAATPRASRPPDSRSTVAATLARTTGLRSGSTSTPVPRVTVAVRAASAARVDIDSRNGNGRRLPRNRWSHTHSER
jgi:hypothetical protein